VAAATGAAQIDMDPTGFIVFSADTSKASGSSASPTERARINANGLQIGTTTETVDLGVYASAGPTLRVTGDNASFISNRTFSNTLGNAPWFYATKGGGTLASPNALALNDAIGGMRWFGYTGASSQAETARISVTAESAFTSATAAASYMAFFTNVGGTGLTEAARFTSAGHFLISSQTTALGSGNTTNTGSAFLSSGFVTVAASAASPLTINRLTSTGPVLNFYTQGTLQGWVTAGALAVSLVNASDYRLKHAVAPLPSTIGQIMALKPVSYKWNELPDVTARGFIAHELAEVCPEAVFGKKDALKDDGSIDPQGVDTTKLIPLLVKAIQEQQAAIVALEARLAALEPA
jgi:hypothetical protein